MLPVQSFNVRPSIRLGIRFGILAMAAAIHTGMLCGFESQNRHQGVRAWLADLSGRNIAKQPDAVKEKFKTFVKGLARPRDVSPPFGIEGLFVNDDDAYVFPFESAGDGPYLIYLNPHTVVVPSAEHAWLYVVDKDGNLLSRYDFDTGWRMYSDGADYETVPWLSTPVLTQRMRSGMNGDGPREIYLGFVGYRPAVVRLEDGSGAIRRMDYFAPNWVVGPRFKPESATALVRALRGPNEVLVMQALVWLDGLHGNPKDDRPGVSSDPDSRLYLNLIHRPEVVKAVTALRRSQNDYVKKLAKAVPLTDIERAHLWEDRFRR